MEEVDAPLPKLTRSRSRAPKVMINEEPAVQEIEARPEAKRSRRKTPEPEPIIEPVIEPAAPRIKKPRKKPEPGSVPPRDVAFNSARGPINFTAYAQPPYRSPYEHLHGPSRFSHIMSAW